MYSTGNKVVDIVGNLPLEGNTIPHGWYEHVKTDKGKVDAVGLLLLAEIVYWYRPSHKLDEDTGQLVKVKKKFKADILQKSYKGFEEKFGFTQKQTRDALIRLENLGVVKRIFRTIFVEGVGQVNNVMFIELNPTKLTEITLLTNLETPINMDDTPPNKFVNTPLQKSKEAPTNLLGATDKFVKTNTKTTTKTTTKITTKSNSNVEDGKIPYKEIMEYLNQKTGKAFKHTAEAHREKIRGRFNDGFTFDDFITVIDKKVRQWKNSPKMEQYLRPGTLFAKEKFDNYLNEGGEHEITKGSDLDQYDFSQDSGYDFPE